MTLVLISGVTSTPCRCPHATQQSWELYAESMGLFKCLKTTWKHLENSLANYKADKVMAFKMQLESKIFILLPDVGHLQNSLKNFERNLEALDVKAVRIF